MEPPDEAEKEKAKKELTRRDAKDNLGIVLKSLLGATGVGAAFAEVIEIIIPDSAINRVADLSNALRTRARHGA